MFFCETCGESFGTALDLGRHRRRIHPRYPEYVLPSENHRQDRSYESTALEILHSRICDGSNGGNNCSGAAPAFTIDNLLNPCSTTTPNYSSVIDPENPFLHEPRSGSDDINTASATESSSSVTHSRLATTVFEFYEAFEDVTIPMWPDVKEPCSLDKRSRTLVDFCLQNRMSANHVKQLYDLLMLLGRQSQEGECATCNRDLSFVQNVFRNREKFYSRVLLERRFIANQQGWREAHIRTRIGNVDKGVFRPIGEFLRSLVASEGGVTKLIKPEVLRGSNGQRVYSSPLNSDAMIEDWPHACAEDEDATPVYFSIYCDKTMLAKSGAGDGCVVRVRVENLQGQNQTWHEIGYAPTLSFGPKHSEQRTREARLELFHRFLHLLLRDITNPDCYGGESVNSDVMITPRLLCIVCDQPQEREFLGLMRGQSHQDCSLCTFLSMRERNFNSRRRQGGRHVRAVPDGEGGILASMPILAPPPPSRITARTYESRSVLQTVALQLKVALLERKKRCHPSELKKVQRMINSLNRLSTSLPHTSLGDMREKLSLQSALKLPSALGSIPGIVSGPGRLFQLCGIDVLHTFDLGLSRQFCDETFKVLSRPQYSSAGRSKADLIRICNIRIGHLPPDSGCRSFVPFKTVETDKQASFTGKHRRLLAPFLWYAVMGLSLLKPPDEDDLLCSALYIDAMQADLRGTNCAGVTIRRSDEDVWKMQRRMERASDTLQQCFQSQESTKYHRLRVHLADHIFRYGNLRTLDTSQNDKNVKKAYQSTNKKLPTVPKQLVQVNLAAQLPEQPALSLQHHAVLLTRDPRCDGNISHSGNSRQEETETYDSYQEAASAEVQSVIDDILSGESSALFCINEVCNRLLSCRDEFGNLRYESRRSMALFAKFEWEDTHEEKVRQIVYSGDNFKWWGGRRHDTIVYSDENGALNFGMVQLLLSHRNSTSASGAKTSTMAVIRPYEVVEPEPGNYRIVREFGFQRFKYLSNGRDVSLKVVPWCRVQKKAVVVLDMWDFVKRHGYKSVPSDIEDTSNERLLSRFFLVKNFSYTSLGS